MAGYYRAPHYKPYKPRRPRGISDKTFWRGIAILAIFSMWAIWRSYNFFIG